MSVVRTFVQISRVSWINAPTSANPTPIASRDTPTRVLVTGAFGCMNPEAPGWSIASKVGGVATDGIRDPVIESGMNPVAELLEGDVWERDAVAWEAEHAIASIAAIRPVPE